MKSYRGKYKGIVRKWTENAKSKGKAVYLVKAAESFHGRWQQWKKGKRFHAYKWDDDWVGIALNMDTLTPVTVIAPSRVFIVLHKL